MPKQPLQGRFRAIVLATITIAGAASLFAWPLPAALAETCLGAGAVAAGVLVLGPEELLARLIVTAIVGLAAVAPGAAHSLLPARVWPRWEPMVVVIAAGAAVGGIAGLVTAIRERRAPEAS